MVYSDGIHIVADSIVELHQFAKDYGINKCFFEGVRKGHPHYDWPKKYLKAWLTDSEDNHIINCIKQINSRQLLKISKRLICHHKPMSKKLGYIAWHNWAEQKILKGHVQKQCANCKLWFFKCEM